MRVSRISLLSDFGWFFLCVFFFPSLSLFDWNLLGLIRMDWLHWQHYIVSTQWFYAITFAISGPRLSQWLSWSVLCMAILRCTLCGCPEVYSVWLSWGVLCVAVLRRTLYGYPEVSSVWLSWGVLCVACPEVSSVWLSLGVFCMAVLWCPLYDYPEVSSVWLSLDVPCVAVLRCPLYGCPEVYSIWLTGPWNQRAN